MNSPALTFFWLTPYFIAFCITFCNAFCSAFCTAFCSALWKNTSQFTFFGERHWLYVHWYRGFEFLFFILRFHCFYMGIGTFGFPVLHFFCLGIWVKGYYSSLHRVLDFCSSLHSFIAFTWVYDTVKITVEFGTHQM